MSEMTMAPDGGSVFLYDDVDGFVRLDARTAEAIAVAPMKGRWPANVFVPFVIAFTSDGSGAYVQWVEPHHRATVGPYSRKCGVSLWSLEKNTVTDLVVVECWYDRGVHVGFPSEFAVAQTGVEWQVLEWPETMQSYKTGSWILRSHSTRGSVELGNVVGVDNAAHPELSVGMRKLCVMGDAGKIVEIPIDHVRDARRVRSPSSGVLSRSLAICESRQWLWTDAMNDRFYIRDLRRGQWLAACEIPRGSYLLSPSFSKDGSRVLAIRQENPTTIEPNQKTKELLVWDLRGLTEMAEKSD